MFAFSMNTAVKADDPNADTKRIEIIRYPSKRPKAPSMQIITCLYYSDGFLSIEFLYSEGEGHLTISDETGNEWDYTINTYETSYVNIGILASAKITLTTEQGFTYTGVIE